MAFKFSWLCELLDELERQRYQRRATYSKQDNPDHRIVAAWYHKYTDCVGRTGQSGVAFLSALLPERRPDRTYNLQDKRLTHVFGRALGLGATRMQTLQSWQKTDGLDFAACVEMVMAECEFPTPNTNAEVTLEEIDEALTLIAANTLSSSPNIKLERNDKSANDHLRPILHKLRSSEAKWLVRMIRKSYSPVEVPEYATLHGFHFMLPRLLEVQNSLEAAVQTLDNPDIASLPARPSKAYEVALMPILFKSVDPQLGVMIKRQALYKARSIKHCVKMTGSRVMSVERKYDGEYCQIHVNRSKGPGSKSIQIFSKSGRDSTVDRLALHDAIRAGLKLDRPECKIHQRAILEGELLVYSRCQKAILPFHHVRKHVQHGGRRIGTNRDSPKKSDEHLMIVFFDVLMLDDRIMINEPHSKRRTCLKALVTKVEGVSQIVERSLIDFSHKHAPKILRDVFSIAIRKRWEGFMLKGLEDPYFSWRESMTGIKLKKDYISGLGDTADMCIIGGRRDARDEFAFDAEELSWTKFYVACLLNKESVRRYSERPVFRIVDSLGIGSLWKDDMLILNSEAKFVEHKFQQKSEYMTVQHPRKDIGLPTAMFIEPLVVEIMGAGYERPQTVDFYTLRFPRKAGAKVKLHKDRGVADTVSFDELQRMAETSLVEDADNASQEDAAWIEKLEAADPKSKYVSDKSQSISPYKTPHSDTTVSLTPGTARRASTQHTPLLVRIDSDDMTTEEFRHRYPDSAPLQTPSRASASTMSPICNSRSSAFKRDSPRDQDNSIHKHPSTVKRVKFSDVPKKPNTTVSKPLMAMKRSTMNERNNSIRNTTIQQTHGSGSQASETNSTRDFTLPGPRIVSTVATTGMPPTPEATAEKVRPDLPAQATSTASQAVVPTPPSTASGAPVSKPLIQTPIITTPTPFSSSPAPRSSPSPQNNQPPLKPNITTPVYIPPSLSFNPALEPYLENPINPPTTSSTTSFLTSLLNHPPKTLHIILVDTKNPHNCIADIKRLGDALATRTSTSSSSTSTSNPDIWCEGRTCLLFDFRVLDTCLATALFLPTNNEPTTAVKECTDKRYFCGVMRFCERPHRETGVMVRALYPVWDVRLEDALVGIG